MSQCASHWLTGHRDQAIQVPVHLEDEIDRAGDRQGADEEDSDNAPILRRNKAEAREDDSDPEDENDENHRAYRTALPLDQLPPHTDELGHNLQRAVLQPALRGVFRIERE